MEAADGVPAEFVGKDVREIVQMAEAYKQAAMSTPPPQAHSYQGQYQPPQQAAFSYPEIRPPDPSLMYANPAEYQRQADAWNDYRVEQRIAQVGGPLINSIAEGAKWQSRNDAEYAEVWQKWGHEIEAMAAQASRAGQAVTNKGAWDFIASVVRGNHVNELAESRAKLLMTSTGFGTERGSANGSPPAENTDPLARLFATVDHPWVRRANHPDSRTTPDDVRKYCAMRGIRVEDYVNDILKGNVITAGAA